MLTAGPSAVNVSPGQPDQLEVIETGPGRIRALRTEGNDQMRESMPLLLLGAKLSPTQWVGAALLAGSILLVVRERRLGVLPVPKRWLPLPSTQFGPPAGLPPPPVSIEKRGGSEN